MFPLEATNLIRAGPEYSNIAETQEKALQNNCMKMIETYKEEMNCYLKEVCASAFFNGLAHSASGLLAPFFVWTLLYIFPNFSLMV